jgi:hypothetical protein
MAESEGKTVVFFPEGAFGPTNNCVGIGEVLRRRGHRIVIAPTWQALLDGARYVDERLLEIFEELQPDAIVEDNVCCFPAILASGRPCVQIVSCNPSSSRTRSCPRRTAAFRSTTGRSGTRIGRSTGGRSTRCRPTSASSASSAARRPCRTAR